MTSDGRAEPAYDALVDDTPRVIDLHLALDGADELAELERALHALSPWQRARPSSIAS